MQYNMFSCLCVHNEKTTGQILIKFGIHKSGEKCCHLNLYMLNFCYSFVIQIKKK